MPVHVTTTSVLDMTAGRRVVLALAAGFVCGVATAFVSAWQVALLVGWDGAAAVMLAMVWGVVPRLDEDATRSHATREDSSRRAAELVLVAASVASLAAVALDLIKASHESGMTKFVLTTAAIGTVALSWATVHTVFALRYAHEYYTPPVGGIDFKTEKETPIYVDFAYVAFTVGMTFQVSDTDIQQRKVRATVLRHALLAYLFGAVIIAVTINVVATLFQ